MDSLSSRARSRRSHPTLPDLHITPLTRDPLVSSPFVDDDYDPLDSQQSRSYLSSRSLPQTPSILSRSPSRTRTRSRSRGHRRNAKSMLTLTSLDDGNAFPGGGSNSGGDDVRSVVSGGPYTPGPYGPGGARRPKSAMASGRVTPGRVRVVDRDRTDFLLRTASLLVENASESKGQGWISKRNSSTNLTAAGNGNGDGAGFRQPATWEEIRAEREGNWPPPDDEYAHSPAWSRATSRKGSRRGSVSIPGGSHRASRRESRAGTAGLKTPGTATPTAEGYFDNMSLEFAEEGDWDESSDDEEIDEGELKRLLRRRVGGFFEDIFGGWLDFRGEDDDDQGLTTDGDEDLDDKADAERRQREIAARKKIKFAGVKKEDIVAVRPPADTGSPWSDASWLAGLARRALI